jgi:hypothetical protein
MSLSELHELEIEYVDGDVAEAVIAVYSFVSVYAC